MEHSGTYRTTSAERKRINCSVVIPARNAAAYILDTLRSLRAQTAPPQEVLVVDDFSTDETAKIVSSFDPKVKVLASCGPGGASRARNLGIDHAAGEWIAFLDADDVYRPDHLETMHASLEDNPDSVMVFCDTEYMDSSGSPMGRIAAFPEFRKDAFLGQLLERNRIISTSAAMARKEALKKVGGFDENLKFNEEYDLWLRLAATYPVAYTARPTLLYRLHPDNTSRNLEGQRKNEALALQKQSISRIREGLRRLYSEGVSLELALAGVLFRRESYADCRSLLEMIRPGQNTSCRYFFLLGNLSSKEGDFFRAAEYYRAAIHAESDFAPAINDLGVAIAMSGDLEEARHLFQKASGLRDDYRDPAYNLGILNSGSAAEQMHITYAPLRKVLKPS